MNISTLEELCLYLDENSGIGYLLKVPERIYRAHPYISQSELKVFSQRSPAHFREYREHPPERSADMQLGVVAHTAILEPMKFDSLYMKGPDVDLRTKKGKEEWALAEEIAKVEGKTCLRPEIYTPPFQMMESLWSSQFYGEFLKGGLPERSIFASLRVGGMPIFCKGRLDYFKDDSHEIIDLKTTESAAPADFEQDIRKYKYHWQAAFYIDLVTACTGKEPTYNILAIEKRSPYAMCIHRIGFDLISIARREIQENLLKLADCMARDHWPAYPQEINIVRAREHEWRDYKKSLRPPTRDHI